MSYILVPIEKLHMEQIIKLGDYVFFPSYCFDIALTRIGENVTDSELEFVKKIFTCNTILMEYCSTNNLSLAITNKQIFDDIDHLIAQITVDYVNRSMDSLRIELCRFDQPEQLPGTPGIVGKNRIIFIINSGFQYVDTVFLSPYYYNMQPGIGLDIDNYGLSLNESQEYLTLNLQRNDEVFLEYRSIIARACTAMHIIDINRCFVYLFSTVERMVSREYVKFSEKKKRILSYIAKNQKEYDMLSDQFFFYSKYVRTEIVHKGENILKFVSYKKANNMLNDLKLLIIRFSIAVIDSGITEMSELDKALHQRVGIYEYNIPLTEFEKAEVLPIYGDLGEKKYTFIAEVKNLSTKKVIKLGDVILLPKNSIENRSQFYRFYVYLDTFQENSNKNRLFSDLNIDKKLYAFDLESIYNVDDLECIYELLHHKEIQHINSNSCIAMIRNQSWLKNDAWSSINYAHFSDYMSDNINKAFSYILLLCKATPEDILPSRVGIPHSNDIRAIYRLDENNKLKIVLGRIYEQYIEPDGLFNLDDIDINYDEALYNCLYNHHNSDILKQCQTALNSIVECLYFADLTISITYMFDILDMLDPESTEGDKLKSNIIPFISCDKKDYHIRCARLKEIRNKYRSPLLHQGKSIYELVSNQSEIISLFGEIRDIIVSYCKCMYTLGITSQGEFILKRNQQQHALGLI